MKKQRNGIINSGGNRPESYNTWTVNVPARNARGLFRRDISSAIIARFHEKYAVSDGCWLWQAGKYANGYGMVNLGRWADGRQHTVQAHRIAYVLTHGDIPAGAVVMHTCGVPACVNPVHLRLGTQADNVADGKVKGHYKGNGVKSWPGRKAVA